MSHRQNIINAVIYTACITDAIYISLQDKVVANTVQTVSSIYYTLCTYTQTCTHTQPHCTYRLHYTLLSTLYYI